MGITEKTTAKIIPIETEDQSQKAEGINKLAADIQRDGVVVTILNYGQQSQATIIQKDLDSGESGVFGLIRLPEEIAPFKGASALITSDNQERLKMGFYTLTIVNPASADNHQHSILIANFLYGEPAIEPPTGIPSLLQDYLSQNT
jgi:hypothetical protein